MTGSSVASNLGSMPTTIGSSLAIAPLAYPLVEHKDFAGRRIVSLLLFLLAITLFMNSSLFPWRTRLPIVGVIVSFLAKIQFSWRFLSIATLLLATISIIALAYWEKKSRMASVIILALAISFSTVEALYGITSWVGSNDLVDTTSIIKTGKGIYDAQFIPADNYKNQPNYSISVPQTTNSNQSRLLRKEEHASILSWNQRERARFFFRFFTILAIKYKTRTATSPQRCQAVLRGRCS